MRAWEGLEAEPDDLPLNVHQLAESVFCGRAGILALEQESEDPGTSPVVSPLDYLPELHLGAIQQALMPWPHRSCWPSPGW